MRTFDLRIVQRGLRRQLEASENLLDIIDDLRHLQETLNPDQQAAIDRVIRKIAEASSRIVDGAGEVSDDIQRFIRNGQ